MTQTNQPTPNLDLLNDRAWAMSPGHFAALLELAELERERLVRGALAAAGGKGCALAPTPAGGSDAEGYSVQGGVAVIPVHGVLTKRPSLYARLAGGVSTERVQGLLVQALKDPAAQAIVLDIDSPGGTVDGTAALAARVYAARWQKPLVAFANGRMTSGAYWLGSAASRIVAGETAEVGAIGVALTHRDRSGANEMQGCKVTVLSAGRYKAAGSPDAPLTPEAAAYLQGRLEQLHALFVGAVARNRGLSPGAVREKLADGRAFIGAAALRAGLVDRLGERSAAIALARELLGGPPKSPRPGEAKEGGGPQTRGSRA